MRLKNHAVRGIGTKLLYCSSRHIVAGRCPLHGNCVTELNVNCTTINNNNNNNNVNHRQDVSIERIRSDKFREDLPARLCSAFERVSVWSDL